MHVPAHAQGLPAQGLLTLVSISQPATPCTPRSQYSHPTAAAAHTMQRILAIVTRVVAPVVDQAKELISHLLNLTVGYSS